MANTFYLKQGVVYKLTSKTSGKSYIGQTTQPLHRRIKRHSTDGEKCRAIGRAISKYGIDDFEVTVLCETETLEELNAKEIQAIKEHNTLAPNGYNLHTGGNNYKVSEETRKKLSESHKGIRLSDDAKKKVSEFNKGKVLTEQHKKKLKESWSDKRKQRHRANLLGKRRSSKLTEPQVMQIKSKLREGETPTKVANLYNVSISTINNIKYGTSWKTI